VLTALARVLAGNKTDLSAQRKVSTEEGKKLAERLKMDFFETSAKDKSMVDDSFFALTRDIKKRLGEHSGPSKPSGTVLVSKPDDKPDKKSKCC
jgi:GTPase SAR1 family protein